MSDERAGALAFGAPGIAPTWTSSAKDEVTTALGSGRLWATVGFGILNEVYWPGSGRPQIRDMGFILAGQGQWVEVKRARRYNIESASPGAPLVRAVHAGDNYRLELEFLPDPSRDVLLIAYRLDSSMSLYPLLAPHLGGSGRGNTAWVERGLHAVNGDQALALLSSVGFERASAGYVGFSDGWQDFARNGAMTWEFGRAENGNVAIMGELPPGEGVLALGFASTPTGAATLAGSALDEGYRRAREAFLRGWHNWCDQLELPSGPAKLRDEALLSAAVLKVHEDRDFPGATVASLSVPWGFAHDDPGGYHLVWARDAVEAGFSLVAIGDTEGARRMLSYLVATQASDGHWAQNFFPDGRPFWTGIQLDETGFPILLAAKLREMGAGGEDSVARMVRAAASYLAQNGPLSPEDRWEENPGASPFTLAVEVAALAAAADWLDGADRDYALGLADCWNERIEEWTYLTNTELAQHYGVAGHYVRIGPDPGSGGLRGRVELHNRVGEAVPAKALVGLEFLYLARLGLRSPTDPRVNDTLAVVDGELRVELPTGTAYRRYEGDGYGEHADGSPFDGTGIGRAWPLLAGERGHGALMRGEDPVPYLESMAQMTGPGGLIPEQVWDAEAIPAFNLYPGKPTGSAMPLVWAHSEYLKLYVGVTTKLPVERLVGVERRYGKAAEPAATWFWRDSSPFARLPAGRALVLEAGRPFTLHFGYDGWQDVSDRGSDPLGLGMHGARVAAEELLPHKSLQFTRRFDSGFEGRDWDVELTARPASP
ncbi:MAG TPA: glycoside hydrolase family 15 protein [Acidimicrobiales bacterium]|nr:glycoside hydrolase family 15 protein [Acidimicrobiales bacterium]